MKLFVRVIRENHYGAHFEKTVTDKVDAIKDLSIAGSIKATWLIDNKNLVICILEWCE